MYFRHYFSSLQQLSSWWTFFMISSFSLTIPLMMFWFFAGIAAKHRDIIVKSCSQRWEWLGRLQRIRNHSLWPRRKRTIYCCWYNRYVTEILHLKFNERKFNLQRTMIVFVLLHVLLVARRIQVKSFCWFFTNYGTRSGFCCQFSRWRYELKNRNNYQKFSLSTLQK